MEFSRERLSLDNLTAGDCDIGGRHFYTPSIVS